MSGFFDRMLGRNDKKGSSEAAKARLKFVLEHERINITPEKLKEMRERIVAIIAEYIPEVELDSVDVSLEQSDRYQNKIVAEIPFTKTRTRRADDPDGNDDLSTLENETMASSHDLASSPLSTFDTDADDDMHSQETVVNEALANIDELETVSEPDTSDEREETDEIDKEA